jgi:uncharacterized membrane protein
MIAFLFSPIGKALGIFALVIAVLIGLRIWLASHDHAIREEMVKSFEQQAAEAQAKEAQRQAAATKAATDALNAKLASAKAAEAKANADLETRISSYEAQLAAAHRDCALDGSDIEFLQHDSGPGDSLGHH